MHKDVLCSTSEYFKRALNGAWKEACSEPFMLPDIDAEAFSVYINWLYTQRLGSDLFTNESCNAVDHSRCELCTFTPVFRAYLLGDYLGDRQFRNKVIDRYLAICIEHHIFARIEAVLHFWNSIPKSSGLRRLLVDQQALLGKLDNFEADAQLWPHDFLLEVANIWQKLYFKHMNEISPEKRERCYYHDDKSEANHCKANKD